MATRGLIGIVKYSGKYYNSEIPEIIFVYNHSDSYPKVLLKEIIESLKKCKTKEDYKKLEEEILSGEFTNEYELKNLSVDDIDFLYHEYIYILDFEKKKLIAFKTIWKGDNLEKLTNDLTLFSLKFRCGYLLPLVVANFNDDLDKALEEAIRVNEEALEE